MRSHFSKQRFRAAALCCVAESLEPRRLLTTFYVSNTGSDSNTGLSPGQALAHIQAAANKAKFLAIAAQPQDNNTILVAAGTYTYSDPLSTESKNIGLPAVVGVIDQRLTITGGYNTAFTATGDANSIIDGQGAVRGVTVASVLRHTAITMSNFTIQNCLAGPDAIQPTLTATGGGMIIDMGGDQTQNPTDTLTNVTFQFNTALGAPSGSTQQNGGAGGEGAGGGLSALFARNVVLDGVNFNNNFARGGTGPTRGGAALGGGFYGDVNSNFTGSSVAFTNNQCYAASSSGAGITGTITADGFGGGFAMQSNCSVAFSTVIATNNVAQGGDGGSAANDLGGSAYGGAFYSEDSSIALTDATISGNTATAGAGWKGGTPAGGAIFSFQGMNINGTLLLNRAAILNNVLTAGASSGPASGAVGGGVAVQQAGGTFTASLLNDVIAGNQVKTPGGAAAAGNSGGGAVWIDQGTLTLEHNTLADNSVQSDMLGQAILIYGGTVNIAYSIIANHNSSSVAAISPVVSGAVNLVGNTLFANNSANGTVGGPGADLLTAGSAGFVDASNRNYNLLTTSPAVAQAVGSTINVDQALNSRTGTPDLGALQYVAPLTPSNVPDKLGDFRPGDGAWSLDSNGDRIFSPPDRVIFGFSAPGSIPVAGSWTNNGMDRIGDFNNGIWHLDLDNTGTYTNNDRTFTFGRAGDVPIVGNFAGTGTQVGVFRTAPDGVGGEFIIDTNNNGIMDAGDERFFFGIAGDRVVVGDWNGDGRDKVGVVRSSGNAINAAVFSLDVNGDHLFDRGDQVFSFGSFTDSIVIGDWNGGAADEIGVARPAVAFNAPDTAVFSLDANNNHAYDPGIDPVFLFGNATDDFLSGNWG